MSNYQRFQVLSTARQELFCPDSPVWVSRYQLSRDLESGKRLLQTRMVNCSEKQVRQVFLRVVCLGASREKLSQLELVPLPAVAALPGRVFGDDRFAEIPVKGTIYVEAYAQRVRFADGSTWDETKPEGYLAFRAEPVRPEDPHYETLADRARSGGVRNDCYFRARQGLWVCTCGLPNALSGRRCARCGADRLWLEEHMDPNLLDAPAPARTPEPAPAPVVYSAPAPAVNVVPAPFREEPVQPPTIIVQPAPEPPAEEAPASHAGRNLAIVAAVLLFLALGAFCAYKYLLPYLRYQEALRARADGDYDQAVALFQGLDGYRDSMDRIEETLAQKARQMMNEGKYQEAMELYESIGGHGEEIADCLYALGVLAYNDDDVEKALEYAEKLRERFPDYDKAETLAQYCHYSRGNQLAAEAAALEDPAGQIALYQQAQQDFAAANGYEDSDQRILECDYRIALIHREQEELDTAVECFTELGDYKNAAELRLECMYAYCLKHLDDPESRTNEYLDELIEAGYDGAQALRDRLNGVGFHFELSLGKPAAGSTTPPAKASDLSQVEIRYSVEAKDQAGRAVLVLAIFTLPDGKSGQGMVNKDGLARGSVKWGEIPFPTSCEKSGTVTLSFYDAELGVDSEPLDTLSFGYDPAYVPDPETPEEPSPSADGHK